MTATHHALLAAMAARERQADEYALRSASDPVAANRAAAAALAANAVRDLRRMQAQLREMTAR